MIEIQITHFIVYIIYTYTYISLLGSSEIIANGNPEIEGGAGDNS